MSDNAMIFGGSTSSDDRMWGLLLHLSAFVFPFVGALGAYLLVKDRPFIKYHAMQSLLGQAATAVAFVTANIVILVISLVTCGLGSLLYILMLPLGIIPLWGAYKAYNGEWEGYPARSQFGRE